MDQRDDRSRFARELFAPLATRYDRLAEVLSLGQNRRWRREAVRRAAAPRPATVVDVASGTAGIAIEMAGACGARVVAVDLSESMLRTGARNVARRRSPVALVQGRAEELPFPDASFDGLTFAYLLRYVEDPVETLAELARVLRPGGRAASVEFCLPPRLLWRAGWWAYTRTVLPVAGLVTGGRPWSGVGAFLGPSISDHYRRYPLEGTVSRWEAAGFRDVGYRVMSLGGGVVTWGTRRG